MSGIKFPRTSNIQFFGSLFLAGLVALLFGSASRLASDKAFRLSVTRHHISIDGRDVEYLAKTGYLTVKDKADQPFAHIYYTAYTADSIRNPNRPITFVFNGGPGSASIWLHMGAFGPVRVDGKNGLRNNPHTWLGFTDLVFIDPVGTGYSKPAEGIEAKRFFGYKADVQIIAAFIKLYLDEHHRQASPKFIAGESYGALRAVGLADYLKDSLQVKLAGLTLISPALDYKLISFRKGNDLPFAYYLPSYALTAHYHQRLSPKLQKLSAAQLQTRAEAFSKGVYAEFIRSGSTATADIIDSLHYFTGLDKALLTTLNGRITDGQFTSALLSADGRKIGTFDSRAIGNDLNIDPSETAIRGTFTKAFGDYVRSGLKYENSQPYLATAAVGNWNYGPDVTKGYLDVSATLEKVIRNQPELQVKVVVGDYDLATPSATTAKVIGGLKLDASQRERVSVDRYPAGHMIYLNDQANAGFAANGKVFYKKASKTS
ncbi:S10 family peptidase [Mucilaginibacter myungsuensis]|uniref:Peptidase S10 n=1 Tax=Mucilaginibacter myungsuensis TaxID=649104 RepID=A0A929PYX9_9SPHI|nr:peptidase S10 [Mucilaginibacter myungsuensis]MBE9663920.1 peptidase S10 [Mucilaginibacter myungsuensis]MDN3598364.1 hypothetical protein [Mucilaginibacter myungsuensis]